MQKIFLLFNFILLSVLIVDAQLRVTEDAIIDPATGIRIESRSATQIVPIKSLNSLPEKYDLRDLNLVTSVKNKQSCGCCWAFATIASIEGRWMKMGFGEFDLSEQNIRTCNGFYTGDLGACEGGDIYKSIAYLS